MVLFLILVKSALGNLHKRGENNLSVSSNSGGIENGTRYNRITIVALDGAKSLLKLVDTGIFRLDSGEGRYRIYL